MYSRLTIPRTTPFFFFLYCFRDDSCPLSFSLFLTKALLLGFRVLPLVFFCNFVFFLGQFSPPQKTTVWTFGDFDDFDDMAITAGYGNTKFVDDAQVRLLDSFCYWLLLFFVVVVFEREEDSQIISREWDPIHPASPIRCVGRETTFSRRRHTPALGGGDDFVATFFSLSLVDDYRKITTTSLFFFFFSRYSYHKNRSRKRRND